MTNALRGILSRATAIEEDSYREFWSLVAECGSILREIDPNERRPWLSRVIREIHEQQRGICPLCSKPVSPPWHVDHIIPVSYGGGNESSNLRIVHPRCNLQRGNRGVDPWDLLRYLEDKYMNRKNISRRG